MIGFGRFRRDRFPRLRQRDITDCGAACLAAVAEHHGLSLPVARIRQHAATDERGTTLLGLIDAAEKLGFEARAVRAPIDALLQVPLPAIAHVVLPNGLHHFVVVCRVTTRYVLLMDPGDGQLHRRARAAFESIWEGVLLLLAPADDFRTGDAREAALVRFLRLVRPHRGMLVQAFAGAAAYTLLGLSTAVFVQKLVDHVLPTGNRNLLNLMGAVMVILLVVQVLLGAFKSMFVLRTGQSIDAALIFGYYRHVLTLPQRFFETMRVGEVISRVNDAVKIRAFINDVALDLAVQALVVAFSLSLMAIYSWRLTVVVAITLPLYALIYAATNRANRTTQRRLMETAAEVETQLVESVSGAATIKRFGSETFAGERFERRLVRLLRNVYRSGRTGILARSGGDLIARGSTIALLWIGGVMVIERRVSPGELMSFYALIAYLTGPVLALISANRALQDALIAGDRLFEILDLESETGGPVSALPGDVAADVVVRDVTFRYGGRGAALTDVSLRIPAGRITAVVGESGSGKSTLAALLQRVHDPTAGTITLGGLDLRHLSLEALRRAVAIVPQQVDLFAGSLVRNIALGDDQPDMRRLLAICDELGISEFVEALPRGFQTEVGEHGVRLSGGQRQRIAVARALYRQPRLLILDEATSSLDSAAEKRVLASMASLRDEGAAVVVIAHRLSTIASADTVVVLEGGRVADQGEFAELIGRAGPFRRLWSGHLPDPVTESAA